MTFPIKKIIPLESIPDSNRFGAKRKFDIHTGLDLFAPVGELVYACESGKVIDVCMFTGPSIGMPWWMDTKRVSIQGKSGIILYGEIEPKVKIGDIINEGDIIGYVLQVLIKDKGKPMSMLHIEWYENTKYTEHIWEAWELNDPKPLRLKNIEELLY